MNNKVQVDASLLKYSPGLATVKTVVGFLIASAAFLIPQVPNLPDQWRGFIMAGCIVLSHFASDYLGFRWSKGKIDKPEADSPSDGSEEN